jgi:hypothetical protein
MAGSGRGGGEEGVGFPLEAAVDITAEGGEAESTIGESRERGSGGRRGKVGVEEGCPSSTEEGTLATWLGAPGKEVCAVGRWEVGNGARGCGNAVGSQANGAGVGDDKRAGGSKGGGAVSKTTKAGGELEEGLGIGREGAARKFLEELKGGGIEGGGKGGGPGEGVKGRGDVRMGVEVRGKEVGGVVLGAFAEELGTGLEVGEATMEGEGGMLEVGEVGVDERVGEGCAANGLAKRAGASGEFGGGAEDGESLVEEKGIGGGEGGGGTSNGGKELGLGEAQVDAVRAADAFKFVDVKGEVLVAEASTGVVNVGKAGGGGERVMAGGGAGGEGEIEFGQDFVEDKASKEGAEGTSLGKTFGLEEVGPAGVGGAVPAGVGGIVEEVKEGEEAGESGMAAQDGAG